MRVSLTGWMERVVVAQEESYMPCRGEEKGNISTHLSTCVSAHTVCYKDTYKETHTDSYADT